MFSGTWRPDFRPEFAAQVDFVQNCAPKRSRVEHIGFCQKLGQAATQVENAVRMTKLYQKH